MAGYGGMAGAQDTTAMKKKWVPPDKQPINQDAQEKDQAPLLNIGEQSGLSQDVINQMMSGQAFDPYRQMSQEATGRAEANQRALTAGKIAQSGQVGQGMAGQIAGATEQNILGNRFDQMLNTQMAEQEMKERGVGAYQRGRGLEADIAYKEAGLGMEQQRIGEIAKGRESSERIAGQEIGSRERMAAASEKGVQSRFGRELTSRERMAEKSLEEQRLGREGLEDYRGKQLDLMGEELGLKREMFESDNDFRDRVQEWQEKTGEKEFGLKEKGLNLQEQRLELDRLEQLSNAAYQKGQLELGWGTLNFNKMSFTEKLDLQKDAQKWLKEYQQGSLDLGQLQQAMEEKYKDWIMENTEEQQEKAEEMKWVKDENGNWVQVPKYP